MNRWCARVAVCSVMVIAVAALGQVLPGPGHDPVPPPGHAQRPARLEPDELARARGMVERALTYLRAQQDRDTGGWAIRKDAPSFPAITGLVVAAFQNQPGASETDSAISGGLKFILNNQQPDGGIYDRILPSYNTAISLLALTRSTAPPDKEAAKRAREFLKGLQYGEGAVGGAGKNEAAQPVPKDHAFYGGWGYGNRGRPDLSNSAWAIEALRRSGVESTDSAFARAVTFLERCQMVEKAAGGDAKERAINDSDFAKGSTQGGFIYSTSVNKDRVGVGQSFAGETVESLSGAPGTQASVRFKAGGDGKPVQMKKTDAAERLAKAAGELGAGSPEWIVLLGATGDGLASNELTVRSSMQGAADVRAVITKAFADELDTPSLKVEAVQAWRGESRLRAYGSMTYSGFKSYLYANLPRDDARVAAAMGWIRSHYTLQENPGLGNDGLYYYFVVFARAMNAWGEPSVATIDGSGRGVERRWAADVLARLAELQEPDGSFRSVDARWMEDDKVLITAYATLALQAAMGLEPGR